jgi:hypothetical protein
MKKACAFNGCLFLITNFEFHFIQLNSYFLKVNTVKPTPLKFDKTVNLP